MKTKILKFVLPVFAMFLAMSMAFATNASTDQVGYYDDPGMPGVQQVSTNCSIEGELNCKVDGFKVYSDPSLSIPLWIRE